MTATPPTTSPSTPAASPTPWRARVRAEVSEGRAAAKLGWRMVRARPALLLWRTVGVGVGGMLSTILWVMILGVILLQVGVLDAGTSVSGILSKMLALCTSPEFIVGALGCAASVTAISWFADATSEAGVWEACAGELDQKTPPRTPWPHATRHIAHVMGWQLARRVMGLAGALLFMGVYVGLIEVQMIAMPAALKALAIALLYSTGLMYAGLWMGIMAWYPAMAITRASMHPGERLLHAARRTLMHPVAVYRLFLHVIAPVIPLFVVSFLLTIAQVLTLNSPELNSLTNAVGLLVDLLAFVGVVAAGMAWRAGSTCLEASWSGALEPPQTIIARQRARAALGKSAARSTFAHLGAPHPAQPEVLDVRLTHLRPAHTPNVLALSDMLEGRAPAMPEAEDVEEAPPEP